jgi:hypothetical protein
MVNKTVRTSEGLRTTLFDTLDAFRNNEIDSVHAKTVSKLADSLLKSVALDLEHKRLISDLTRTEGPQAVAKLNLNIVMAPITESKSAVAAPRRKAPTQARS